MTFPISLVSRPDLATLVASYTITERPLVSWMPGKCIPDISRCSGISAIEVGCLNFISGRRILILETGNRDRYPTWEHAANVAASILGTLPQIEEFENYIPRLVGI
uniref:Uncharacterized protein n=1 Tax=Cacopsylla melanoneura TaxID=428564 RepID=A0A8D8SWC9_9HEMI